jgi:hypothetical protein
MTKKQAIFNSMVENKKLFDSAGKDETKIQEIRDALDSAFNDVLEEDGGLEYLRNFTLKHIKDDVISSRIIRRIITSKEENLAHFLEDKNIVNRIAKEYSASDLLLILNKLSPNNRNKLLNDEFIYRIANKAKIKDSEELLKHDEIKNYILKNTDLLKTFIASSAGLSAFKELTKHDVVKRLLESEPKIIMFFLENQEVADKLNILQNIKDYQEIERFILNRPQYLNHILKISGAEVFKELMKYENVKKYVEANPIIIQTFFQNLGVDGFISVLKDEEMKPYLEKCRSLYDVIYHCLSDKEIPGMLKLLDSEEFKTLLKNNPELVNKIEKEKDYSSEQILNNREVVEKLFSKGLDAEFRKAIDNNRKFLSGKRVNYFEKAYAEKENLKKALKKEVINILRNGTIEDYNKSDIHNIINAEQSSIKKVSGIEFNGDFFNNLKNKASVTTNEKVNEIVEALVSTNTANKTVFDKTKAKDKKYVKYVGKDGFGSGKINKVREEFSKAVELMMDSKDRKIDMTKLQDAWNKACVDFDLPSFTVMIPDQGYAKLKFDKNSNEILDSLLDGKQIDKSTRKKLENTLDDLQNSLSKIDINRIQESKDFFKYENRKISTKYSVAEKITFGMLAVLAAAAVIVGAVLITVACVALGGDPSELIDFNAMGGDRKDRLSSKMKNAEKAMDKMDKLIEEKQIKDPAVLDPVKKSKSYLVLAKEGIANLFGTNEKKATAVSR